MRGSCVLLLLETQLHIAQDQFQEQKKSLPYKSLLFVKKMRFLLKILDPNSVSSSAFKNGFADRDLKKDSFINLMHKKKKHNTQKAS